MMRNLVDLDILFLIVKYFDAGSHLRYLYIMPTLFAAQFRSWNFLLRLLTTMPPRNEGHFWPASKSQGHTVILSLRSIQKQNQNHMTSPVGQLTTLRKLAFLSCVGAQVVDRLLSGAVGCRVVRAQAQFHPSYRLTRRIDICS